MKPAGSHRSRSRSLARSGLCAWLALGSALALGGAPRLAEAQPVQTDARAIALFKEARGLMEKGRFAEACSKFEDSLRIDPGMGTLFNLSDCYERIGRTASAWRGFSEVAAAAEAAGQVPRAQAARDRATAIEPKLPKLRITVSKEAASAGVTVQRDGVEVSKLIWGVDAPVDPGTYVVSASAPGMKPWSATTDPLEPGKLVTVVVPPLSPAIEVKDNTPPSPSASAPPPRPPPVRLAEGKSAAPAILLGTLAVAGAGGGVALLFGASAKEAAADRARSKIPTDGAGADNECLAKPAPAACSDLASAATSAATMRSLSIGAFVLGGVGMAGLALYLIVPSSAQLGPRSLNRGVQVLPVVSASSGGLVVSGSF